MQHKHPPGAPPIGAPPDGDAVSERFGLGPVIRPISFAARGELGRIWRLPTRTGVWAVKELLSPPDEAAARADVAFQEAALAAGIPLPRPVRTASGDVVSHIDGAARVVAVRVYGWVDLAAGPVSATPAQAADILGRLHADGSPDAGTVDPWFTDPVPVHRWNALVDLAHRSGASWASALELLVPQLVAGRAIIAAGQHAPTIRCHLDFNPQNVLLDAAGAPVVVDWENSGPAAAEQELASVLAEFVPDGKGVREFLAAYQAAGGPVSYLEASSFAMTLAVQSHLVETYADRALDVEAEPEDRARAAFWIEDIAANVFTPTRVAHWVAQARC